MACSKSSRQTGGLVYHALELDIVIDKILECFPIDIAAQTSVLSKQWRRSWLSLKSLVFNHWFCQMLQNDNETDCTDRDKWSKVIGSILLYHKGPVHCFELYNCYEETETDCITHGHWLSFLSKNGVRKISIEDKSVGLDISPYIFCCSELVHLSLDWVRLSHPPSDFRGYRNLKHLELCDYQFAGGNSDLCLVIANCRTLAFLRLEGSISDVIDHIVIDFPSLKTLIIRNIQLQSIAFRNVQSLECISLYGILSPGSFELIDADDLANSVELIDADNLANSSQLQSIKFDGFLCKFLLPGGMLKSLPVKFEYLSKLYLSNLDSNDFGLFDYILPMLGSCPYITVLNISFLAFEDAGHEVDHNYSSHHQLAHLRKIKIKGIIGSNVELKLIENLLAISIVLGKLFVKPFCDCDTESRLKISMALNKFPRASTKAQIVFYR